MAAAGADVEDVEVVVLGAVVRICNATILKDFLKLTLQL